MMIGFGKEELEQMFGQELQNVANAILQEFSPLNRPASPEIMDIQQRTANVMGVIVAELGKVMAKMIEANNRGLTQHLVDRGVIQP